MQGYERTVNIFRIKSFASSDTPSQMSGWNSNYAARIGNHFHHTALQTLYLAMPDLSKQLFSSRLMERHVAGEGDVHDHAHGPEHMNTTQVPRMHIPHIYSGSWVLTPHNLRRKVLQ
jgi:hypothetical protein